VLSTTQPGGRGFAPAFVGDGYLAARQPAQGYGFAVVRIPGRPEPLPTQSQVQGFYAKTTKKDEGLIERRAALPAWSTLSYDDGSGAYSLQSGRVRRYLQSFDMRTGTLTTQVRWTSPGGGTVELRYDVTPDRSRPHAALVRPQLTPRFSGRVTVADVIDGRAAQYASPDGIGHVGATQWVSLRTRGLGVRATVATVLARCGHQPARPRAP
jgi:trehalose/maltose hydrolase-like predicted phosphorylase